MTVGEGARLAVLYARVSDKDKQNSEQMLRTLHRYAEGREWAIDSEHEDKVTGDPARRGGDPPGLRMALERVQALGGRGVLVITDATRLVRSPVELIQLVDRIQRLPGAVASVEDGGDLDTTQDTGEFMLFLKGWFGRWYLKFIRKQTRRVLDDRKALVAEKGGFVASKSKVWRTRLGRPSTPDAKVAILRAVWSEGVGPNEAGRRAGVPASTARTWFGRFGGELHARWAKGENPVHVADDMGYPAGFVVKVFEELTRGAKNGGQERAAEDGENTGGNES